MTTDTNKPDMEAMMAEWAKYAMPGPCHELFKRLAGEWTVTLTMWMEREWLRIVPSYGAQGAWMGSHGSHGGGPPPKT